MERTPHVAMDFKELPIPEKPVFGQAVIDGISNNPTTFTNPDVKPADLKTVNDDLRTATEAAQGGDHQKVAAMHDAEKKWETTFGTEAEYVDRVANGSEPIIRLGGYKPTKSETAPAQIPGVLNVTVLNVNPMAGSLHVEVKFEQGVKNILYFVATTNAQIVIKNNQFSLADNPSVIAIITDSHRKVDFYSLPSKANVFVSVAGQNTAGIGAASLPQSIATL